MAWLCFEIFLVHQVAQGVNTRLKTPQKFVVFTCLPIFRVTQNDQRCCFQLKLYLYRAMVNSAVLMKFKVRESLEFFAFCTLLSYGINRQLKVPPNIKLNRPLYFLFQMFNSTLLTYLYRTYLQLFYILLNASCVFINRGITWYCCGALTTEPNTTHHRQKKIAF